MLLYFALYKAEQQNSMVNAFFKSFEGATWYGPRLRDSIVLGVVVILATLAHLASRYYSRPISLSVTQKNASNGGGSVTHYYYKDTCQQNRTIQLTISIARRNSWNWLLRWYLKKYKVYIIIKSNSPSIELQAQDEALKFDEIIPTEDGTGFYIDITEHLQHIAKHDCAAGASKVHPYYIKETRTSASRKYANGNEVTHVNPVLLVNDYTNAPWLLRFLLKWEPDQHQIEYFIGRNGNEI